MGVFVCGEEDEVLACGELTVLQPESGIETIAIRKLLLEMLYVIQEPEA